MNHSLTIAVARKPIPCAECGRPLPRARRLGRKRRHCSNKCRSAARRTRNFVSRSYPSSRATQNVKNNPANTRACKGENAGRGSAKVALTPALWEAIIEIETGLPKPPAGHQTVCNLHADDRRTSFVASRPQYASSLDRHFCPHFCSSAAKRSIPSTESEPG
jgi:hypothetical protein